MPSGNDIFIQTNNIEDTFRSLRRDPLTVSRDDAKKLRGVLPDKSYPSPVSVSSNFGNMTRFAASPGFGGTGGGTIYGQPMFFSPVHTPINWQIPSKRKEQYQWSRFFYENEPKVAASIDFYSFYPMNGYENICNNHEVKKHFDELKRKINLDKWLRLVSHEVHLLGDCFPFLEIECPLCGGSGRIGDMVCDHEGGTVKRIVILNPDYVEVFSGTLDPEPIIALLPDEELIKMVQNRTPGFERLTEQVRTLVAAGQPIPLDNRSISHIKYGESGYSRYGVGMVRRLFPILSYKTKLMVAQWIVAERLIVPIKIVKVGSDDRPAGPADIAAVQAQLAQTANDPNLTIVTHHAFDFQWEGACHDEETEVLTENGWKKYSDVSKNYDEKIATYNNDTGLIEYDIPRGYHEYEYNGDLCYFSGKHYDIMVTPNHKMLASLRKWDSKENKYLHMNFSDVRADNVIENSRFKSSFGWNGKIPKNLSPENTLGLELDDYLEFAGFYISEGGLTRKNGKIYGINITQSSKSECFRSITKSMAKFGENVVKNIDRRYEDDCHQLSINCVNLGLLAEKQFGSYSESKKIPKWILDLPKRELRIILNSLLSGDGNVRLSGSGSRYCYSTISKKLADQVQEIVFKLGFCPKVAVENRHGNNKDIFRVYWSDDIAKQGYVSVKERNISRHRYYGKVWCFETNSGYFVTRRNGKVTVQGNSGKVLTLSNEFDFINQEILDGMMINNALLNGEGPTFANASIGIESMIERLETFRREMSLWVYNNIYIPESIRQGFIEKNPTTGIEEYIYPTIKWNPMHLRDQQQYRQFMLQLHEKGLVSAQTVLEAFELEPDKEIERKRYDALQMMALGQGMPGMGGEMGGGFGGMPGMEGGMGGGMPGMEGGMGGGMPGMEGGMGGGMPGMGEGMGGGMGGAPVSASTSLNTIANPSEFGGKVLKKKTRTKLTQEKQKVYKQYQSRLNGDGGSGEQRDEKGRIIFTGTERELFKHIHQYKNDGLIRYPVVPQYRMQIGGQEYPIDFAIPSLKIAIEADGEIFHSAPKQLQSDRRRDRLLNQAGWTVIRFKDNEIESQIPQVMSTIMKWIMKKEMAVKNLQKGAKK